MSRDVQRRNHEPTEEIQDLLGLLDDVQRRVPHLGDGAHRSPLGARLTYFFAPSVQVDDATHFLAAARELTAHLALTKVRAKLQQERHAGTVNPFDLRKLDFDTL